MLPRHIQHILLPLIVAGGLAGPLFRIADVIDHLLAIGNQFDDPTVDRRQFIAKFFEVHLASCRAIARKTRCFTAAGL